jgi:drug/metabolite transporter (DMT)-like permease
VLLKKGESFRLDLRQLLRILALAVTGSVLTSLLLFQSIRFIDTGIATSLNFSYPALVVLLDRLLYRQKAERHQWVALGLCLAGVVTFIDPGGTFTWKGFFLALGSGLAFALYVLYMDRSGIMKSMSFYAFSFWFFLFSSLLLAPFALASGELRSGASFSGWVLLAVFALIDGLAGTLLQEYGVNAIGGKSASIASTIEPVICALLGAVFLHERITLHSALGICLIVGATVYLIVGGRDRRDRDPLRDGSGKERKTT